MGLLNIVTGKLMGGGSKKKAAPAAAAPSQPQGGLATSFMRRVTEGAFKPTGANRTKTESNSSAGMDNDYGYKYGE